MAPSDRSIASGVPQWLQPRSSARVTARCSGMHARKSCEKFHARRRSYTVASIATSRCASSSGATSAGRSARIVQHAPHTTDHHAWSPKIDATNLGAMRQDGVGSMR